MKKVMSKKSKGVQIGLAGIGREKRNDDKQINTLKESMEVQDQETQLACHDEREDEPSMAMHSLTEFHGASIKSGRDPYNEMGSVPQAFSVYRRGIVDQMSSYPTPSSKHSDGDN